MALSAPPPSSLDPRHKTGRDVQRMFAGISHRYDALNRILSAGRDRHWRAAAVEAALGDWSGARAAQVLDVCCGTGDLALEFRRHAKVDQVVGVDFVSSMVQRAADKSPRHPGRVPDPRRGQVDWLVGDALQLPFPSQRFDVVSVAFGLRNLVDPRAGITEMQRLLRPGGRLVILEFFPPRRGISSALFRWYLHQVLPRVGRLVTGSAPIDAYRYLPESMESFAPRDEVLAWMAGAGLEPLATRSFLFGTVGLLVAGQGAGSVPLPDVPLPDVPLPDVPLPDNHSKETAGLVRIA